MIKDKGIISVCFIILVGLFIGIPIMVYLNWDNIKESHGKGDKEEDTIMVMKSPHGNAELTKEYVDKYLSSSTWEEFRRLTSPEWAVWEKENERLRKICASIEEEYHKLLPPTEPEYGFYPMLERLELFKRKVIDAEGDEQKELIKKYKDITSRMEEITDKIKEHEKRKPRND